LTEEQKQELLRAREVDLKKLCKPTSFPEDVVIYFGSQTGTAEKFSHIIDEECQKLNINSKVIDLDKFSGEELAK